MPKFFFTPARRQNVAMVTNSGVIAVPSTRNDNCRYSLSHLNAVVTPEIYIVYVAEVSNIPQLVFFPVKCIIQIFKVHFFILTFSVRTHYSHYLYYKMP